MGLLLFALRGLLLFALRGLLLLPFAINIRSLAFGGDSVGILPDGRVAFVPGGCPGDSVLIDVTKDCKRFVRAAIVDIIDPSPDRVMPACPHFAVCGGCQWQHVSRQAQLSAKRSIVADALQRIGKVSNASEVVGETVTAGNGNGFGYRNKIELVADTDSGATAFGFCSAGSGEVVPIQSCLLLPKRLQRAPKAISGVLRYLSGSGGGLGVCRASLRVAHHTRDVELALWTPPGPFPRAAASRVLGQALPLSSLTRVLFRGDLALRDIAKTEVLAGKGLWREHLGGYSFAVSSPSFFQTNTLVAERLTQLVLEALDPDGTDTILDLYAGAGTFTLPLAEAGLSVTAVESSGPAVKDLVRNLESNGLSAEVICGDVGREAVRFGHFDLAVVDPPRSGLAEEAVGALSSVRPRAVAYVSCDPATLARDVKRLAEEGFALTGVAPVDLFPQTFHIECVARFERFERFEGKREAPVKGAMHLTSGKGT